MVVSAYCETVCTDRRRSSTIRATLHLSKDALRRRCLACQLSTLSKRMFWGMYVSGPHESLLKPLPSPAFSYAGRCRFKPVRKAVGWRTPEQLQHIQSYGALPIIVECCMFQCVFCSFSARRWLSSRRSSEGHQRNLLFFWGRNTECFIFQESRQRDMQTHCRGT